MENLNRYAALRPLIACISGILLAYYGNISHKAFLIFFLISISIGFIIHFKAQSFRRLNFSGILFFLSWTAISGFHYSFYHNLNKNHFKPFEHAFYNADIKKVLQSDTTFCKALLHLQKPNTDIIAYIKGNQKLLPGDHITFKADIRPFKQPANPGQFNTKQYYAFKKIYGQVYLHQHQYNKTGQSAFNLTRYFYQISSSISTKIKTFIPNKTSAALVSGVLLGTREDIDKQLMNVFSHSGVMHILSVSGMHAGLLYAFISLLIRKRVKRQPWLRFIPVVFIWMFALLTGAGPAVLRAALIITLADSGEILKKKVNSLNLLMGSAIFLLIYQPWLIWDIGFQLSYGAMAGIVLYYKNIGAFIYFKNKFVQEYIWSTTALSIAAQTFTLAPSLYYFGILPISFILSNLVILFPVMAMMFGGIAMIILGSFYAPIGFWLGKILAWIIQYLFILPLEWLDTIPFSYLQYVHFSAWQCLILTLGMALIGYWLLHLKKIHFMLCGCWLILLTIIIQLIDRHLQQPKAPLMVYQVAKMTVIGVPQQQYLHIYTQPQINQVSTLDFHLAGSYRKFHLQPSTHNKSTISINENFIITKNKIFFILHKQPKKWKENTSPIQVDYILLHNNPYLNTKWLMQNFQFTKVIIDGSNTPQKRQLYAQLLQKAKIPYHDTAESGVFEVHNEYPSQ